MCISFRCKIGILDLVLHIELHILRHEVKSYQLFHNVLENKREGRTWFLIFSDFTVLTFEGLIYS